MKIAVINSPFASHIGRMDFVLKALRARGHDIELWGSGATRGIAEKNGFTFRPLDLQGDYEATMQRKLKAHEFYTQMFFPMAKEQIPTVLEYCRLYKPDLLEANTRVYSAAIAAKLLGIPVVNHNPNGFSFSQIPDDLYGFCVEGNESARQKSVMRNLSLEFFAATDEWFNTNIGKAFALPKIENAIGYCSDTHVMAHTIKELSKARIADLPHVFMTGPIMTEAQSDIDFTRFKPYCYLSLGTCPWSKEEVLERYRTLAKAISREYRIVIGLGELLSKDALGIEDDRVIVFEKAPQLEAIRHCEFVVCHGGCQTVHEALHFGKPVIGIPYHAELNEMVNAVEINNAGMRISPSQLNPSTIDAAVTRAASSDVIVSAQKLSASFMRMNAQHSIVKALESLLNGPS